MSYSGAGKGYQCEIKESKLGTSAPNDVTRDKTMVCDGLGDGAPVDLMAVAPDGDTESLSKEQTSRNEAVEETLADFKSSNAEPSITASERLDLVKRSLRQYDEQVVPQVQQATLSSSSELERLRHSSNLSPFEYNENIMVSVPMSATV